jgi:uncharacterized membrane protein YagU involved in acid resistance
MKTDLEFERAILSTRLEMARAYGYPLGVAIAVILSLAWPSLSWWASGGVGFFVAFFIRMMYKPANDVAWQKADPEQYVQR